MTRLFSGRPARGIPNRLIRELAAHEAEVPPYPVQNALMLPIRQAAAARGQADSSTCGPGRRLRSPGRRALAYFRALVVDTERALDQVADTYYGPAADLS